MIKYVLIAALCLGSPRCEATSIVVTVDDKNIYVVADNRVGFELAGITKFTDDACKILLLGHSAVTAMGSVKRFQADAQGTSRVALDVFADAKTAAAIVGSDDTARLASEWVALSTKHVAEYYNSNFDAAMELRGKTVANLDDAIFVGWKNHTPIVRTEYVALSNGFFGNADTSFPIIAGDNSPNPITQELIDGISDRAKKVVRRWQATAHTYPASERAWRHAAFLITETSKLDQTVSQSSDVLRVSDYGRMDWLHSSVCK